MHLVIGADHRGFAMMERIVSWLLEQGHDVHDVGATDYQENDDYPEYAARVAQEVAASPDATQGIVLCGSGVGVAIVANKVTGIRAALIHDSKIAKAARNDDDINILALGADYISLEDAKRIITAFLETKFSGEDRHMRRIKEIAEIEKGGSLLPRRGEG